MKKLRLVKSLVLLLSLILLSSCDNEPLSGEFIDEVNVTAEPGQFLCNPGDGTFEAADITATLFEDGSMSIIATNDAGDTVTLFFENANVGTFDLTAGSGVPNFASYVLAEEADQPYTTLGAQSGTGSLTITEFNTEELFVTGAFDFLGVRQAQDSSGNPLFDDNGNPVIETIAVEGGSFNQIPYTIDQDTGGEEVDEFFARVNDSDFVPVEINVTREVIAEVPVIKIIAVNENGRNIRIDIPEATGVGTFDMVNISDGTQLIGIFNLGDGSPNLTSDPGTITITQFSTQGGKITATFEFTGVDQTGTGADSVEVTEGSFSVNYTPEPSTEPFVADVDDVTYTPDNIQTFNSVINEIEYTTVRTIDPAEQEIRISFPTEITTGSYTFVAEAVNGDEVTASYNPDFENGEINFTSVAGTFVVSSYDPETGEMEASFIYTATDPAGVDPTVYEITNGLFFLQL
ncbi:DUF6252 family protein [Patiriisocius hiemis]|uniref:DUF6252 family protein n=1 Tax=Patiriisocius hiemis TaxID=3075604 RepID=A0ABU2Y9V9_9FLAO|nr:DUF6252 family protein [Constantimarinum sp. W242]MDT0554975.1 DUF6252 family protein [Constantimarinum sp. W242]